MMAQRFTLPWLLAFAIVAIAQAEMEEPKDYHGDPYRGEVPATLEGAHVVHDDEEAFALWENGVQFIDVLPRAPKPELPEGTVWHEKPHQSIEGAIWLPNVGYEALADETMDYFLDGLSAVTETADAPLLFFCQMDCWMSWNAAKRALEIGYTDVYWYPDGVDGWGFMDYPLVPIEPWAMN